MKPIKLKTWKIKLPLFPPDEVSDNSTNAEYARCPRRGFYRYGLRRGFVGVSFPLQFGSAYHKYREVIEDLMVERECGLTDEIHDEAQELALKNWEEPPIDHRHSHLSMVRMVQSIQLAKDKVTREREQGRIIVTKTEDSFDLELPFMLCPKCGWTELNEDGLLDLNVTTIWCPKCLVDDRCSYKMITARHGGRVDQFIRFVTLNDGNFIRDFKTTGRMGQMYDLKFEPNSQMQGYVWGQEELSGQKSDGALIETLYNTKNVGPEIHQTYKTYSKGQQESWVASLMMERQMIQMMWSRVEELGYLAFPQRTNACGDFGGCGYREACLAGSSFEVEAWLKNYTVEREWDFTNPSEE